MNVQILRVVDKGNINSERIVLKILANDNIGHYAIFRSGINSSGTGITNKVYSTYWFPDSQVRAGDLVVLYTKSGIATNTSNSDGTTTRFYYWGFTSPVWNNGNYMVTLVTTPAWNILLP